MNDEEQESLRINGIEAIDLCTNNNITREDILKIYRELLEEKRMSNYQINQLLLKVEEILKKLNENKLNSLDNVHTSSNLNWVVKELREKHEPKLNLMQKLKKLFNID